jgi:flagellar biosynthesis protein FlhF
MKIRRYFGKDMREALRQVKAELGDDAVIMSTKKLADGVELVAAYDKEPAPKLIQANAEPTKAAALRPAKKTPTLSEIIGDSAPDSLKALLDKQQNKQTEQQLASERWQEPLQKVAPVPEIPVTHNHQDKDQALEKIEMELQSLRDVLQFQVAGLIKQDKKTAQPQRFYLISQLKNMGFSEKLAEEVSAYLPEKLSDKDAWKYLMKLLANRLPMGDNSILSRDGIYALVGPTGTGKTTTIAKLAAQYAQKRGGEKVGLVTIDTYRIGAFEQLATYGKILGCTVKKACNAEELAQVLHQYRNKDLVLIDTAGFGQRDTRLIQQLQTLEHGNLPPIQKMLVMQANNQYPVLQSVAQSYKKMCLDGCIFTKLDECYSLGEVMSVSIEHNIPVSYVTDGQRVPEDIKIAEANYLISMAARLYKDAMSVRGIDYQSQRSAMAV